jgi:cytochrome aa3-600 menaquinol oxidase subunit 1
MGFGLVFEWYWLAIPAFVGVFLCLVFRSFEFHDHHHIPVKEIEEAERAAGRFS